MNFGCKWACRDLPPSEEWGTHCSSCTVHLPNPHHTQPHGHISLDGLHPKYLTCTYCTSQAKEFTKLLSVSRASHIQQLLLFLSRFFYQSILAVCSDKMQTPIIVSLRSRGKKKPCSSSENTSNFNSRHQPKNNPTWFWSSCLGHYSYFLTTFPLISY